MINIKETRDLILLVKEYYEKAVEIYISTLDIVAFTTSIFINNILRDIKFIERIEKDEKNSRYIYSILRVTIEQIIIYKFLMREQVDNKALCEDFLGENIDIEEVEKLNKSDIELLKMLGGKRTVLYQNNFKRMAQTFEDVNEETSLYNLYSLMADYVHNAYYKSSLNEIGEEELNIEWINNIVLFMFKSFSEAIPKWN